MADRTSERVLVSLVGNVFPPLSAFVTAPILAQVLGVEGRGELGAATAPLLLALGIATFGMPEAMTHYVGRSTGSLRAVVTRGLAWLTLGGALGTAAIILLAPALAAGSDAIARLIAIAAVALLPSLLLSGLRGVAAGLHLWGLVTAERLISSVFRLGGIVALAVTGTLTELTATIVIAGTSFVGAVVYVVLPRHVSRRRGGRELVAHAGLLSFGSRVWVGSFIGILLARFDQAILLPLSSAVALGLYVVAVSISELPLVFNSAMRDVMFSSESESQQDERLALASRTSTIVTAAIAVVIALVSIPGIPFLFGADFADALVPTLILLGGVVLGNPGSIASIGLSARGRPGLRAFALAVGFTANLLLIIVLAPILGATGAAIAACAGAMLSGFTAILWIRKLFGFRLSAFYGLRRGDIQAIVAAVASIAGRFRRRA
ncbi:O-antigen/teichoic acid export membrane protein [Microbacteriaceae bacterium SG_E_30_P1]|uniref:O-antigen/teichoic acid export membrane protein n=1 Tax=Antiquaquibacter oligotrophicus TaxID=2880260 RepID=A0ABT6KJW4_9MICO|nr:oligosaccharide flippase family protein [Antiquaquibacter oligotrophicus]MDH6180226.1 O-antigen/teichoic acid export membrane protein [Antiquaquibacter oligotrophicus]UDF14027.1 oligosaccharide flippase family protein [Antiquaquibacter oligotrophicus]